MPLIQSRVISTRNSSEIVVGPAVFGKDRFDWYSNVFGEKKMLQFQNSVSLSRTQSLMPIKEISMPSEPSVSFVEQEANQPPLEEINLNSHQLPSVNTQTFEAKPLPQHQLPSVSPPEVPSSSVGTPTTINNFYNCTCYFLGNETRETVIPKIEIPSENTTASAKAFDSTSNQASPEKRQRLEKELRPLELEKIYTRQVNPSQGSESLKHKEATPAIPAPQEKGKVSDIWTSLHMQVFKDAKIRSNLGDCDIHRLKTQGKCTVKDFYVKHEDYGIITFPGSTEVTMTDLDQIRFKNGAIIIYPDDSKRPPIGKGLNVPAVVSVNIWPKNTLTGAPILKSKNPVVWANFKMILKSECTKFGGQFVSYDSHLGIWTFKVQPR